MGTDSVHLKLRNGSSIYPFSKLAMCYLGYVGERNKYMPFAKNRPKVRLGLNCMFTDGHEAKQIFPCPEWTLPKVTKGTSS